MLKQVMEDESAEAIQFECLLVEPQDDHVSVDAFLCFHRNSSEKNMEMENFPCRSDGLKFGTDQEKEHLLGQEVLDLNPSKIEAENFQEPTGPSSTCEDYLLDVEFGDGGIKLDNDSTVALQNLVSGSYNQVDRAGDNGTTENSDSSGTADQVSNCQGDLDMTDSESHNIFSCTADGEMSLEQRWFKYPTFSIQNLEEDVSSMFSERNNKTMSFTPGLPSGGMLCPSTVEHTSAGAEANEESFLGDDASLSKNHTQAGSFSTSSEKRLRKPPQRFIDELSEPKSTSSRKRKEVAAPTSKIKLPHVSYHQQCDVKSRGDRWFPEESTGIAIQVPFGPIVQKESRTTHVPVVAKVLLQPNIEASMSGSDDDDAAEVILGEDGGRRKHHILWTVSEVRKLMDGVSQYGVGRWSRIKKDFFSSSAHRTPVDLKDKWRNLLKASCAQGESKRGDDRKRNLAWRPLPKSILQQVSELATLYPYPRDLRSKR
ncbi:hypothetical protein ACH5RR_005470 [Cinchona calisaya]|uniref:Uncharacterized protein n=1 Tax=Cinchona calisaya TaxID=153742 RepID=A0ABD3ALI3_9GENT